MVGHVAYALYKRDKLHFCEAIKAKEGREPLNQELVVFIQSSNLPKRIEAYRDEAEFLLEGFAEVALELTIADIEKSKNDELVRKLSEAKSWRRAIIENLVANLLALSVVALLAVVLYGTRIGFGNLLIDVFDLEVSGPRSEQTPR